MLWKYGTWLATRNPKLGVQIFADDSSRVRFTAKQALDLLKTGAPQAVKDFLQHLVFAKNVSCNFQQWRYSFGY